MEPVGIEPTSTASVAPARLAASWGQCALHQGSRLSGSVVIEDSFTCIAWPSGFGSPVSQPRAGVSRVYWCWLDESQGLAALREERLDLGDAVVDVVLGDGIVVRI